MRRLTTTLSKTMPGRSVRRIVTGAAMLGAAGVLMTGQTASAAPYDGTNPSSTGCANTARTVSSLALNGGNAVLELRYSSGCRTAWARLSLRNGMVCEPGNDRCGFARVVRDNDGRNYTCHTPAGWHASCYTLQVNDAGVTSHAYGCFDNGAHTYCGRTRSY